MTEDTLHILWVNDNPLTVEHMIFMYATNSLRNNWWDDVHIIAWGAATKLLCENKAVQEMVRIFQEAGGHISACKRCAEKLGVLDTLESIPGVDVLYIGKNFTEIVKSGEKVISI